MGKQLSCAKLGIRGKPAAIGMPKATEKKESQLMEIMLLQCMAPAFTVKMERKIEANLNVLEGTKNRAMGVSHFHF